MAGGQERILRRRIKTVQSTKKITRAMELTADRGLAGGYNSAVIRAAERSIRRQQERGRDYHLVLVGRKAQSYFRYRRYDIAAAFTGFSDNPGYENAREVAAAVTESFVEGDVDRVELVYTQFLSAGSQRVTVHRFLPLETEAITESADTGPKADYEFEPEPEEILARLLPRYVEARLFAALLEAAASEHAARQRAMKSATDNADDLITSLSRTMNRARQDAITTEIMEIVGGAEALRQGGNTEPPEERSA